MIDGFTYRYEGSSQETSVSVNPYFESKFNDLTSEKAISQSHILSSGYSTDLLLFSSFLGGVNYEGGSNPHVGVDGDGNFYVAGNIQEDTLASFNITGYEEDCFIAKLNSTGYPIYVTVFGGSGYDTMEDFVVDLCLQIG